MPYRKRKNRKIEKKQADSSHFIMAFYLHLKKCMEKKNMEKKIVILEETVRSLEERLEKLDLCFELLLDTLESKAHKKQPSQNVSSYFSVN